MRSVAVLAIALVMGSGTAFASGGAVVNAATNTSTGSTVTKTSSSDSSDTGSAADELTEEENGEGTAEEVGSVKVEGETSEMEESEDVLLFSTTEFPDKQKVKLTGTKTVKYENNRTHLYKVKYGNKTQICYCIEPGVRSVKRGKNTAKACDAALMKKCVYYSYGYPGYKLKTKSYLASANSRKIIGAAQGTTPSAT